MFLWKKIVIDTHLLLGGWRVRVGMRGGGGASSVWGGIWSATVVVVGRGSGGVVKHGGLREICTSDELIFCDTIEITNYTCAE